MKLARQWGCTLGEAQARCDSHEFALWMAEETIEPSGELRADWRMAQLCAVIVNSNPYRKGRAAKPSEFMPRWGKQYERPDPLALERLAKSFVAASNAAVKKTKKK